MPELPEVETTLRAIKPVLLQRTITHVDILRPNMTSRSPKLASQVQGAKVLHIDRHGKYLFVTLNTDNTLVIHLKISGRLGVRKLHDTPLTYERIRLTIDTGDILVFNDPRTLGRMWLLETKNRKTDPHLRILGPDALTVPADVFLSRLQKKTARIKTVLLDQSFIAGVGNIYADEACFLAKIDPRRRVNTLTKKERVALYTAVIATLEKGVKNMGTSFSDFADLFGKPGQNQHSLAVYGRGGKPCRRCKTILRSAVLGARTTVWCPKCQK